MYCYSPPPPAPAPPPPPPLCEPLPATSGTEASPAPAFAPPERPFSRRSRLLLRLPSLLCSRLSRRELAGGERSSPRARFRRCRPLELDRETEDSDELELVLRRRRRSLSCVLCFRRCRSLRRRRPREDSLEDERLRARLCFFFDFDFFFLSRLCFDLRDFSRDRRARPAESLPLSSELDTGRMLRSISAKVLPRRFSSLSLALAIFCKATRREYTYAAMNRHQRPDAAGRSRNGTVNMMRCSVQMECEFAGRSV